MLGRLTHNGVRFGMVAAAVIPDNVIVDIDSAGKAILNAAGKVGTGFTQAGAAAIADDVLVYDKSGEAPIRAAATWDEGNYLMGAADGELTPETDPAVPTAMTIAQAAEAATVVHKPYLVRFI